MPAARPARLTALHGLVRAVGRHDVALAIEQCDAKRSVLEIAYLNADKVIRAGGVGEGERKVILVAGREGNAGLLIDIVDQRDRGGGREGVVRVGILGRDNVDEGAALSGGTVRDRDEVAGVKDQTDIVRTGGEAGGKGQDAGIGKRLSGGNRRNSEGRSNDGHVAREAGVIGDNVFRGEGTGVLIAKVVDDAADGRTRACDDHGRGEIDRPDGKRGTSDVRGGDCERVIVCAFCCVVGQEHEGVLAGGEIGETDGVSAGSGRGHTGDDVAGWAVQIGDDIALV